METYEEIEWGRRKSGGGVVQFGTLFNDYVHDHKYPYK